MAKCLNDYKNYLKVIKNRSDRTIGDYMSDLSSFSNFVCEAHGKDNFDDVVAGLTKSDVYSWLAYKQENGSSATSRCRYIAALSGFFTWLNNEYGVPVEIGSIPKPKKDKVLPKYLTEQEALQFLDACKTSKHPEREYAIATLFLNCGLRIGELCSLKVSDIRSDGTMLIRGKGAKERTIYLNSSCISALSCYLDVRNSEEDYLWVGLKGPLTQDGIRKNLRRCFSMIGRPECSPHKLRHTCATLLYQNGVDLLSIRDLLGHESVDTTQIYTHVYDNHLKDAVSMNPLNVF